MPFAREQLCRRNATELWSDAITCLEIVKRRQQTSDVLAPLDPSLEIRAMLQLDELCPAALDDVEGTAKRRLQAQQRRPTRRLERSNDLLRLGGSLSRRRLGKRRRWVVLDAELNRFRQ